MSKKTQQDQPADDWAGLAQNLFGINLENAAGDEDLLDDDMFKVELPKPPEPPTPTASIPQSEVEFAPVAESQVASTAPASSPVAAPKPAAKKPSLPVAKEKASDDEPFGFGVAEDLEVASDDGLTLSPDRSESEDAGLTLPEDFEADGLTLPADYDDGLTLPPSEVAASSDDADESEEEDASDTEVLPVARGEADREGRSESPRRRPPRRTREDAYWDMLENWEWEEIPDHDSPRSEGDRSRSQRGDRGGRSGGRSSRRDRGRDDRPRSENRAPSGDRPVQDERRPVEGSTTSGSDSGDRPRRSRNGDRSSTDRGPREDRPRGERRPERDERRRDEPRPVAPSSNSAASMVSSASGFDDFGSGIFEEQPQAVSQSPSKLDEVVAARPREEAVAQSSRAADAVLRDSSGSANRPIEDELVWPDDDSDVRPAPSGSVVETSVLPPADVSGESDEMVPASDVIELEQDDEALRPRRRRRRRGGPRSESRRSPPPDGNEGTTFDLSDALASASETPDFIPSAAADDSGVSEGASAEGAADEVRSSEQRGRGRRRRRRRPGERPTGDATTSPDREPSEDGSVADVAEASDDESYVVKPITYSNIPSWEEAIKYLLHPNLVGRNLGPDDADESLENDPRGSGGAEPTPPPPPRRGGGRGRGRRP